MAKEIKVVRKDILLSGYNGNLESVVIHDTAGEEVEATNGVFVTVDGLLEGQREVVKATLAATADAEEEVLFVHNPEVMYDVRDYKLEDYKIEAGKVSRAYRLNVGDIITMTEDLFAEKVTVGDELAVKKDGLLGKKGATEAKVVFEVIEDAGTELHHAAKAFAVKVISK